MNKNKTKKFIFLLILVGVAFALRVHLLGHQELRGDEGFSWNYVQDPFTEIVPRILREGDPQPPIHYWLLWGWVRLAGDTEFAMRTLSAFLSLSLVPLSYKFTQAITRQGRASLIMALIMAIHPQQIWLAQDVRNMYQLALNELLLASIILPKLIRNSDWRVWLLYVGCGVSAMYSHYYALFFLIAHGGWVMPYAKRYTKGAGLWIGAGVVIGLSFTPWVVAILPVYAQGQLADPARMSVTQYLVSGWGDLVAGVPYPESLKYGAIILFAVLGVFYFIASSTQKLYLGLGMAVITVSIYLVTLQRSTFNSFYLVFAAPLAYMVIAGALEKILTRHSFAGVCLLILMMLFWGWGLQNHYYVADYSKSRGMRELVAYLRKAATPNDLYLANFPDPTQVYYLRNLKLPYRMLPERATFETAEMDSAVQNLLRAGRIWHVPVAAKQWDKNLYVAQKLDELGLTREDIWFNKMHLLLVEPVGNATPLPTKFSAGINLHGFALSGTRLTLVWEALETIPKNYTVFVHVLAADGSSLLGYDQPPRNGARHTTTWQVGETIIDPRVIPIPAEMPPGEYSLEIGLYDDTGKRLTLEGSTETRVILPVKVSVR